MWKRVLGWTEPREMSTMNLRLVTGNRQSPRAYFLWDYGWWLSDIWIYDVQMSITIKLKLLSDMKKPIGGHFMKVVVLETVRSCITLVGVNLKFRGCFSVSEPGRIHIIQGNMNSQSYLKILDQNILPFVWEWKLGRKWVLLQDTDPKHTSKTTKHHV